MPSSPVLFQSIVWAVPGSEPSRKQAMKYRMAQVYRGRLFFKHVLDLPGVQQPQAGPVEFGGVEPLNTLSDSGRDGAKPPPGLAQHQRTRLRMRLPQYW